MPKNHNKKIKNSKDKIKARKPLVGYETKKSIVAIACFAAAILSVLGFINKAGVFGNYFLILSQKFFGRGFFLIPASLVLVGLAILRPRLAESDSKKTTLKANFIGAALFILSILGMFHILMPVSVCVNGAAGSGCSSGGGYLGLVIGYPLMKFLGFWAALVILLAILVISILITFNISLRRRREKETEAAEGKEPESMIINNGQKEALDKGAAKEGGLFSGWQKIKDKTFGLKKEEIKEEEKSKPIAAPAQVADKQAFNIKLAKASGSKLPPIDFLESEKGKPSSGDIKANINIIKRTLENFNIEVEMAEVNVGPTVTQYTLRPAQGIKLSKITTLQNDLALALAAHPLRIEAPIPGRSLVGIEIPNKSTVTVRLRELLSDRGYKESSSLLTFALGRNVAGLPVFADLARMPHLLIAGATGTGKTVSLNSILMSLLFQNFPETLRLILIDPKRVEFSLYGDIPHLLTPVVVQSDKAVGALRWAVNEMERRFEVLQKAGRRDIVSYNNNQAKSDNETMPYIVIMIDELADLMASQGREVEATIVRLAQMARAVGIHLVVATQRPSVEVITGLIKANITSRIAFQVASQVDSRTILDMAGADKLLGNGDMLFLSAESSKPRRIQSAYVSEKEVKKVTDYIKENKQPDYKEELVSPLAPSVSFASSAENSGADELYEEAREVVIQAGKASASLLQRRLRIGYARAARLLDIMEERGVVGPADGARPRDVYVDEGAEKDNF